MGTTAPVTCEQCAQTAEIEVKSGRFSLRERTASFDFQCEHCGFRKSYESISVDQIERMIVRSDKATEMAQITGLSVEKMRTYVYPPEVMAKVDLERRKIASSSVKAELKVSRQTYPKDEEGWWRVYVIVSRSLEIWFELQTQRYRLVSPGEEPALVADVVALGELLFRRFSGKA